MPPLIAAAVAAAVPVLGTTGIGVAGTASFVSWATIAGNLLATAASVGLQYALADKQPKQHVRTLVRFADAPRFTAYGRVQVEGVCLFYRAVPPGALMWIIQALGHGEIDGFEAIILNGKEVTVDGPGGYVNTDPYNSGDFAGKSTRARVWMKTGAVDQASFIDDPAAEVWPWIVGTWTSAHRLRGVPYAVMAFNDCDDVKRQSRIFPQGVPSGKFRMRATLCWDPRDPAQSFADPATWLFTRNPALIRIHYLTKPVIDGGMAIPLSWIDLPSHVEAADDCDEPVALKNGGVAPRYRFDGTQEFDKKSADFLANIDAVCDGQNYWTEDGKIGYRIGKPRPVPPQLTFSTEDGSILTYSDIRQGSSRLAAFNEVALKFTSPDHQFQLVPCQNWKEAAWTARDGRDRVQPLALPEVQTFSQIRRLGKIFTRKANPRHQGVFRTDLRGKRAWYAPVIRVVIPEAGVDTAAEVLSIRPVKGKPNVDIEFKSVDADTWSWDAVLEEGEPPAPIPVGSDDPIVEAPTDVEYTVGDGPRIVAAADQRPFDTGVLSIRWRPAGAADWAGEKQGADNHAETDATLTVGASYDVSVRWTVDTAQTKARQSVWSDPVTVVATVDATPPTPPTGLSAQVASGIVMLTWTNSTAANVVRHAVYRANVVSPGNALLLNERWGSRGEAMAYNDSGMTQGVHLYFIRAFTADGAFADGEAITVDTTVGGGTKNILGIGAGSLLGAGGGNYLGWGPVA